MLIFATLLMISIHVTVGTQYTRYGKLNTIGGICSADTLGYQPGGGKVMLTPIEAPIASLQDNSLLQIGKIMGMGTEGTGAIVDVAELTKAFAGTAAKLSAALGVWGTLLSIGTSIASPTPDDILKATNQALVELTDEVNSALADMKDYVDQEIRDLQTEIMNDEYMTHYMTFTNCIKQVNQETVNYCMISAEAGSYDNQHKFMKFKSQMNDESYRASTDDVKRIETQFVTFRDYASLRLMTLSTLVATFREMDGEFAKNSTQLYLKELVSEAPLYVEYTKFLYNTIIDMHDSVDYYNRDDMTCGTDYDLWEGGLFGANTYKCRDDCKTRMSPMLYSTQKCIINRVQVRKDGKAPCCDLEKFVLADAYYGAACWNYAQITFDRKYKSYRDAIVASAKNYWTASAMQITAGWAQYKDGAQAILDAEFKSVPSQSRSGPTHKGALAKIKSLASQFVPLRPTSKNTEL